MNHRDYKEFAAGEYYHIYNRGNGKMVIFRDEQDYINFLKRLKIVLSLEVSRTALDRLGKEHQGQSLTTKRWPLLQIKPFTKSSFKIICYCLMPNHFHLVIKQCGDISISKLMNKLCTSYSSFYNKKYKHIGHVFQDRFKAVLIEDNQQLIWTSAYIHQNPKVAGFVDNLKDWQWGSYLDCVGLRKGNLCDIDIIRGQFKNISEYIDFVNESLDLIKEQKDLEESLLDS